MGAPKNKSYHRSWKNYLLDASYQLRFTLFMVLVATALLLPLGWKVSQVARSQTEVALNQLAGKECPAVPVDRTYEWLGFSARMDGSGELSIVAVEEASPAGRAGIEKGMAIVSAEGAPVKDESHLSRRVRAREDKDAVALSIRRPGTGESEAITVSIPSAPTVPEALDEPSGEGDAVGRQDEAAGAAGKERSPLRAPKSNSERPRTRIQVDIDDSGLREMPVRPEPAPLVTEAEIAAAEARRSSCITSLAAKKTKIENRQGLIMLILICAGTLLVLGLAIYSIKMTHKVAGPLYKVSLYLAKLEKEKYDTVYNLRKGDQLIEFYKHFKAAHAGLRKLQEEDRDRLREAVALAAETDLASQSPELAALISELETLLARKEESLGE